MLAKPSSKNTQPYLEIVTPIQVTLKDNFWRPRLQLLSATTIKTQYNLLHQTGRLENFTRAAGKSIAPFQGYYFNDSDVYKWLEAAVWVQAQDDSRDLENNKSIEDTIDLIQAAQQPDGYLNTYFGAEKAAQRWSNLKDLHELYCAGHLIQAAVADYQARHETKLMGIARRLADHIDGIFGPGKHPGVPGHPEIELALVDLYRVTNHKPYLDLAKFFIDQRGQGIIGGSAYHLDHKPLRDLSQLVGHAVRAVYLCAGAADVYEFTGDQKLIDALNRTWETMVSTQLYVTGGIGSRHEGESFGSAYELPNARAYAETCAAIGSVMWNQRMLHLTRDCRYADLLEWTLYNAVLPGISLSGDEYFYSNPLSDQGSYRREKWFSCACCPPNVARTIARYPSYLYATSHDQEIPEIFIYGYAQNTAHLSLPGSSSVIMSQHTNYPWHGLVEINFDRCDFPAPIRLHLRIPAWTQDQKTHLFLNGRALDTAPSGSFTTITQVFKTGDHIQIEFPMQPRWLISHPYLIENANQAVLCRGPFVYCLEGADNPGVDLRLVESVYGGEIIEIPDLFNGILGLSYPALEHTVPNHWREELYLPAHAGHNFPRSFEVVAIPYFAWANRTPGQMQVWVTYGRNL